MPTYEYACSSCKHEWELEQSIKEDAITECPSCHNPTAKRQISRGGGFILKGGGWYADLYSSGSNKPSGAATGEGGAAGATSGTASASDGASGSAATPAASTPASAPSTGGGDGGASAPSTTKSSSAPASS
jgi:putative FmdB family regulatory protein